LYSQSTVSLEKVHLVGLHIISFLFLKTITSVYKNITCYLLLCLTSQM